MVAMQGGKNFADGFAQCGDQGLFGGFDDGDVDAPLTGTGGHLQADPPGTHDSERRSLDQNGIQRLGVVVGAQIVDPGRVGSRYRWALGRRSGGQQQLVVVHRGAVGKPDGMCGGIDRRHPRAESQIDVVFVVPVGVLHGELAQRLLAGQILLGKRRPLVGQVLLFGEQNDLAFEVTVAQGFYRFGPRKSAANDNECL